MHYRHNPHQSPRFGVLLPPFVFPLPLPPPSQPPLPSVSTTTTTTPISAAASVTISAAVATAAGKQPLQNKVGANGRISTAAAGRSGLLFLEAFGRLFGNGAAKPGAPMSGEQCVGCTVHEATLGFGPAVSAAQCTPQRRTEIPHFGPAVQAAQCSTEMQVSVSITLKATLALGTAVWAAQCSTTTQFSIPIT